MAIHTHEPKSSQHIKSVSYDDKSGTLSVVFDHERLENPVTERHRVPLAVFHTYLKWMKDGYSAGQFFHRFIKRYPKVELQ